MFVNMNTFIRDYENNVRTYLYIMHNTYTFMQHCKLLQIIMIYLHIRDKKLNIGYCDLCSKL